MSCIHGIPPAYVRKFFYPILWLKIFRRKSVSAGNFTRIPILLRRGADNPFFNKRGFQALSTGGSTMAAINWLTELEQALDRAKAENKAILLDFFNPN